jgi:hypothetical protein
MKFRIRIAEVLAFAIVGSQIVAVARMPFVDDRFFGWSPHDSRTDYRVEATHRGRAVSDAEIRERYGLPTVDWHAAGNLRRVIEVAEGRRAPADRWSVRLRYRVNLGPEREWVRNAE